MTWPRLSGCPFLGDLIAMCQLRNVERRWLYFFRSYEAVAGEFPINDGYARVSTYGQTLDGDRSSPI
jgi:hypothetical protein